MDNNKQPDDVISLLKRLPFALHADNPNDANREPRHCLCVQCEYIREVRGVIDELAKEATV